MRLVGDRRGDMVVVAEGLDGSPARNFVDYVAFCVSVQSNIMK